jgi:hypothetical protein
MQRGGGVDTGEESKYGENVWVFIDYSLYLCESLYAGCTVEDGNGRADTSQLG